MADFLIVNDYLVQCDRRLDVAVDVHLFTYKGIILCVKFHLITDEVLTDSWTNSMFGKISSLHHAVSDVIQANKLGYRIVF